MKESTPKDVEQALLNVSPKVMAMRVGLFGVCVGHLASFTYAADSPSLVSAVSFRNDVMAVLSKAGCSAGTCHGNKNGKGGLKLSLRGQDPDIDYVGLTRDLSARRVNPVAPEESLILKPTADVPHEGGLRFNRGSQEYELIRRWIAQRMPNDIASAPALQTIRVTPSEKVMIAPEQRVQLKVLATFAGGWTRDVSSLLV